MWSRAVWQFATVSEELWLHLLCKRNVPDKFFRLYGETCQKAGGMVTDADASTSNLTWQILSKQLLNFSKKQLGFRIKNWVSDCVTVIWADKVVCLRHSINTCCTHSDLSFDLLSGSAIFFYSLYASQHGIFLLTRVMYITYDMHLIICYKCWLRHRRNMNVKFSGLQYGIRSRKLHRFWVAELHMKRSPAAMLIQRVKHELLIKHSTYYK